MTNPILIHDSQFAIRMRHIIVYQFYHVELMKFEIDS